MTSLTVKRSHPLTGQVRVPGDKSISHRAVLFGALAAGDSRVRGYLRGGDCLATLECMRRVGIEIEEVSADELIIHGKGLHGWQEPHLPLDCVTSGTTMRLLAGLVAGAGIFAVLTGGPQLSRRPMGRVAEPLRKMGATVLGREGGRLPPLAIQGGSLRGIDYRLPVASAQVKSAVLLAGLFTHDLTVVIEPGPLRDHTERMLRAMGAPVRTLAAKVTSEAPTVPLQPLDLRVPADMSSAAFLLSAGLLAPESRLTLESVGINPTRCGLLDILRRMGADVRMGEEADVCGEPIGHITALTSPLQGVTVEGEAVMRAIDEMPILAVVATQASGTTLVRNAEELRVKETDRIATVVAELRKLGSQIDARPDGFLIEGPTPLRGTVVDSHGDHRLAMALCIAGLVADGETTVMDTDCIADSFPGFERLLVKLGAVIDG
jgi:3-phosphoshikimate 1-carboxyvinyltransferase